MNKKTFSRRQFISSAAIASSAFAFSRTSYSNILGANERLRFALVGCGPRGRVVAHNMIKEGGELVALCDLDPVNLAKGVDQLETAQERKSLLYDHINKVLDNKEIDAVIIATPDHWHAALTVLACQAGKDVYLEKPHAHNIWEGQQIVKAEKRYNRIIQIGTQTRSSPYMSAAREYVRSGKLGDIHLVKVYNLKSGDPFFLGEAGEKPRDFDWNEWQGAAAARSYHKNIHRWGWHNFWDYCGGDVTDDGCHQMDLACMLMEEPGTPLSVSTSGGRIAHKGDDSQVPDVLEVTYEFPDFLMTFEQSNYPKYMRKTSNDIRRKDELPYWTHNSTRIELYGSEMMMTVGRQGGGWVVNRLGGRPVEKMYGRPGDQPHCKDFIDCVKSRKQPNGSLEWLHPSISILLLANIAHRVGNKKLWLNPGEQTFKNDAEANALLKREYRKGFEFPAI